MLKFSCKHRYPSGFSIDLSFVTREPVVALFGPSGSGKTSILEMIAGIREPQSGAIRFDGEALLDTSKAYGRPAHKRRIGTVFQDHLLFPHMTVQANLRYGRRWNRATTPTIDMGRVVTVLELGPLLSRYPAGLSGGERQRVALGRALLSHPRMLLMDEPLTALDDALKFRILAYLDRIVEEWRLPALFVSHSQTEVRRFAQWVVAIDHGRVIAEGTPTDALASPATLSLKNSSGPVNLLRLDDIRNAGGRWFGRVGDRTVQLPGPPPSQSGAAYVQFLPETVLLSPTDIQGISARNHLTGTVRQVLAQGPMVFVGVDVGQIIWSEVTPSAVTDLGIAPGARMTCLIKSHSLHFVG